MPQVTLDELGTFGIELTGEQMDLLRFCIAEPVEAAAEAVKAAAAQPAPQPAPQPA